jgi:hypothetical protein
MLGLELVPELFLNRSIDAVRIAERILSLLDIDFPDSYALGYPGLALISSICRA